MVQGTISGERLLQAYLLFMAIVVAVVALIYGIDPPGVLPRFLDIKVEGADQTHIFRALMSVSALRPSGRLPLSSRTGSTSLRSGRSSFAFRSHLAGRSASLWTARRACCSTSILPWRSLADCWGWPCSLMLGTQPPKR
jgi:hypothetical protein